MLLLGATRMARMDNGLKSNWKGQKSIRREGYEQKSFPFAQMEERKGEWREERLVEAAYRIGSRIRVLFVVSHLHS